MLSKKPLTALPKETYVNCSGGITPKTDSSHNITAITTTTFKIDFIDEAIGINLLTKPNKNPTTIKTIII